MEIDRLHDNAHFSWESSCMGTTLSAYVHKTSADTAAQVFFDIQKTCTEWEHIFSRFLPHSELSLLNTHKKNIVSDIFFEIFLKANQAYDATNGAFNALCSPFFFGYDASFESAMWGEKKPFTAP